MAIPTGGMSVPGASALMGGASMADQVAGETEDQRRKRLMAQRQQQRLPVGVTSLAGGYGDALTMR